MSASYSIARGLLTAAVILCTPAAALACPVCFQVEDGPVVDGVRAAVGVLLAVTLIVLAGFAVFATRMVRRSR
jgi:hypothetical protein